MTATRKSLRILSMVRSSAKAVATALTGIIAAATIFSAYGGCFDPVDLPVAPLAAMLLPFMLIAGIAALLIDLLISWKIALMIPLAWIASLSPLLTFCPLHIFRPSLSAEEEARSFTLLTYNCMHFIPYVDSDAETNPTVDYILSVDADIVNLQEAESLWINKDIRYTQSQRDSLLSRYPYHFTDNHQQLTVLSKFPVEVIDTTIPRRSYPCLAAAYRLKIHDTEINLYNVHLKSIGLMADDKELYREIPSMLRDDSRLRSEIKDVKEQIIAKLSKSFATRAIEAHWLRQMIDSVGGNVIVAGDFNDIPGCYAERVIMGDDLHDAYAACAFGPCITYHDNRFYFRIDHVLYGGALRAVAIRRDTPKYSDHYPILTKFIIR